MVVQECDIWKIMQQALKYGERVLHHSMVTIIFNLDGKVEVREIGLHDLPSRVLGVDHFFCSSMSCQMQARELRYANKTHPDPMKEALCQTRGWCGEKLSWGQDWGCRLDISTPWQLQDFLASIPDDQRAVVFVYLHT